MNEEKTTYTREDLLSLINATAWGLAMKKRKVSLESEVRTQKEEIAYIQELAARAQKKVDQMNPEVREAEQHARETRQRLEEAKGRYQSLQEHVSRMKMIETALVQKTGVGKETIERYIGELEEEHFRLTGEAEEKRARSDALDHELNDRLALKKKLGEEIPGFQENRRALVSKLHDLDMPGYFDGLRAAVSELGNTMSNQAALRETVRNAAFVLSFLETTLKIREMTAKTGNLSSRELKEFADVAGVDDPRGSVIGLMSAVEKIAGKYAVLVGEHIQDLEARKNRREKEAESLADRIVLLETEIAAVEKAIQGENAFREIYDEQALTGQRDALAAEREQLKREVTNAPFDTNVSVKVTTALEQQVASLRESVQKQSTVLDMYRNASEKISGVLREGIS